MILPSIVRHIPKHSGCPLATSRGSNEHVSPSAHEPQSFSEFVPDSGLPQVSPSLRLFGDSNRNTRT